MQPLLFFVRKTLVTGSLGRCVRQRRSLGPGHSMNSEGSHLAPHHGIALSLTGCLLPIGVRHTSLRNGWYTTMLWERLGWVYNGLAGTPVTEVSNRGYVCKQLYTNKQTIVTWLLSRFRAVVYLLNSRYCSRITEFSTWLGVLFYTS